MFKKINDWIEKKIGWMKWYSKMSIIFSIGLLFYLIKLMR